MANDETTTYVAIVEAAKTSAMTASSDTRSQDEQERGASGDRMTVLVQHGGSTLDGMPVIIVVLVPVNVLRPLVVRVKVRVTEVRVPVVNVARFAPPRVRDPAAERD